MNAATLQHTASKALAWWLDGLWLGLPERLRATLFQARGRVIVRISGGKASVKNALDYKECGLTLDLREPAARAALHAHFPDAKQADVTLVVPRDQVLLKTLAVPLAAERELRHVLYHELDRLTPFPIEELTFGYHIAARNEQTAKLAVVVVVVCRAALEEVLHAAAALDLRPFAITTTDEDGAPLPVNLLTSERGLRWPFAALRFRLAVAGIAVAAALLALYAPLTRYDALLERHEREATARRAEAVAMRSEIEEQQAMLEAADFLARRAEAYVAPIDLLADLTTRLPEHTWLTRVAVRRSEVQLQGETTAASKVLEIVERSERLQDAQFQSPVARSDAGSKEQFTIAARVSGALP